MDLQLARAKGLAASLCRGPRATMIRPWRRLSTPPQFAAGVSSSSILYGTPFLKGTSHAVGLVLCGSLLNLYRVKTPAYQRSPYVPTRRRYYNMEWNGAPS